MRYCRPAEINANEFWYSTLRCTSWATCCCGRLERHGLTFYDASWASAGQALQYPLVSAGRLLLTKGLEVTATAAADTLRTGSEVQNSGAETGRDVG